MVIWNTIATSTMKPSKGRTFAIVTTALCTAAPWMPRSTSTWMTHKTTEAPTIADGVLPSPNVG